MYPNVTTTLALRYITLGPVGFALYNSGINASKGENYL
jgi:hypothetical protein